MPKPRIQEVDNAFYTLDIRRGREFVLFLSHQGLRLKKCYSLLQNFKPKVHDDTQKVQRGSTFRKVFAVEKNVTECKR